MMRIQLRLHDALSRAVMIVASFLILAVCEMQAQQWKGVCRHNDVLCYRLEAKGTPMVLAAKVSYVFGLFNREVRERIKLKIKSPYDWGAGSYDARIGISMVNRNGGLIASNSMSFQCCRDGWIYYSVELYDDGTPEGDLILTFYEDNNWGHRSSNKKTIRLHLYRLDTSAMPLNYNLDVYW